MSIFFFMVLVSITLVGSLERREREARQLLEGRRGRHGLRRGQASGEDKPEVRMRRPVLQQRVDVADGRLDLLFFCAQEIQGPDLHGVVLELCLAQDALANRQQHIAVMESPITMAGEPVARAPRNGADAHGERMT